MIQNYIKIAWRNLLKQKLYSFICISGLAVGLAVCMMILLYVSHEMSYDRFHKNADRIFSAHYLSKSGDNTLDFIKYDSGPFIKQSQPNVEAYLGLHNYNRPVIVSNPLSPSDKFSEDKLVFADANFFDFFSFDLLLGEAQNVLKDPFTIVISRDMARKYFDNQNPVGKTITLKTDSIYTYQVTGVAENCPSNSSIDFNFVASGSSMSAMKEYHNRSVIGHTFLLLKQGVESEDLIRSMQSVIKKEEGTQFTLVPLSDIHSKNNFKSPSKINYLKIFPIIAVLILLLALVNYMSLSTARATLRAKEIAVRKVTGASRKAIAKQFYVESTLFIFLSFVLGYIGCFVFKPWFLKVLQLKIDSSFLYSPLVLLLLFILLIVTILLAGSYPSLVLSSFNPVTILKGKVSKRIGGVTVRKVFTTLQFTISIALIICGIVIDRQLYFFRHADTGINRENVMMIPLANSFGKSYPAFRHDIQSLSGISHIATSRRSVFEGNTILIVNDKGTNEDVIIRSLDVDNHFIPVLNLKWKVEPSTNTNIASKDKILINEAVANQLHLNPVIGSFIQSGNKRYEVAGVLKDFNFASMAYAIDPLAVIVTPDTSSTWSEAACNLYLKIATHTNLPKLINTVESIYKKYDQETPFSYSFMDDDFNKQYISVERLALMFGIFTGVAIILAILGLFGLTVFTIEQRVKEIGIRKVLGASIRSIHYLLSVDFIKLVLLAVVIASPIAWWAMHSWLQNFAYRISIPWWIFIIAGFTAILTSIITVGYNAVKAALANPVKCLRSE